MSRVVGGCRGSRGCRVVGGSGSRGSRVVGVTGVLGESGCRGVGGSGSRVVGGSRGGFRTSLPARCLAYDFFKD